MNNIAVLGAGVVGLSTALNIKKLLPQARVTIIADRFEAETTSFGAGGLFRPTFKHIPGVPEDQLRKWITDSWDWFTNLTLTDKAAETGNQLVPGYFFSNTTLVDQLFAEFVYSYSQMTNEELKLMKMDQKYKYGYHVTTIITCCKRYLPWLRNRWLEHGGIIESRKIHDLNEVKADWIKVWMYTEDGAYFIPNGNVISLGGTRQQDNYSLEKDENDSKGVWKRCLNLWPPLKGSEIVEEWVGLRPSRPSLRLEPEIIQLEKGPLKVVHNYGHGANGISLSWGTSIQAAKLVKDIVAGTSSRL